MIDNERRPIRLQNKTNYFDPMSSQSHVCFASPYSYQSRRIKIEGYETRLYWQFRYCQDNDGQTFFYTLTYNDANIPVYEGQPCFDYNHLVYLLNGGFKKILLRKYGTNFRYFVGAELGDGKGKRGLAHNPHYHVLFFLEPAKDSKVDYVKISPDEFRHLVRMYWQGFDESEGKVDYRDAKFGIAREGDNCGLVTDYRACVYCAKYVCKDAAIKANEGIIKQRIENKFSYWLDPRDERLLMSWYKDNLEGNLDLLLVNPDSASVLIYVTKNNKLRELLDYGSSRFDSAVREEFNAYRNRYSNKCRISHGVGDYAIASIKDIFNPSIVVPDAKKGFKNRPISQYYYRKMFTHVVKDAKGQPMRVLSELGQEYKLSRIDFQIDRLKKKTDSLVQVLDCQLFSLIKGSFNLLYDYSNFETNFLKQSYERQQEILYYYAVYKLVYEGRFFPVQFQGRAGYGYIPPIDLYGDYQKFCVPSYYTVDYNPDCLSRFLQDGCQGYISYNAHPCFLQYSSLFNLFDCLSDYLFIQDDRRNQEKAEQIATVKRFHTRERLTQFYNHFAYAS